jgi:hypothetical protein
MRESLASKKANTEAEEAYGVATVSRRQPVKITAD